MSNAMFCVCVCVWERECVCVCVCVCLCLNWGFTISILNQKSIKSIHFQWAKMNWQETQIVDDDEILLWH